MNGFSRDAAHVVALGEVDDEKQNPRRRQPRPNPAARENQFAPAQNTPVGGNFRAAQFRVYYAVADSVELRRGGLVLFQ